MKMSGAVLHELKENKIRLKYYLNLKAKAEIKGTLDSNSTISKWIEIYSDRVNKFEIEAKKLDLLSDFGAIEETSNNEIVSDQVVQTPGLDNLPRNSEAVQAAV